ncbi:hypothetical protein E4U60_001064 [Claviceps pazoutovae]|uniref:Uncharacterized protein n=1 Tax=Claviceps pazoutovae TaxID=1649127 RepID=A0A9P7MIM7_9HYPO|nr:hypothetical protein E4U60_001064 [Claviceps pazoutovae]
MGNQFIPVLYWTYSSPDSSQYSVNSRDPCHGLDYNCSIQPNTDSQNDPSFDHPGYATDGSVKSGIAPVGSASSEVDSYFNTSDSPWLEDIARLFRLGPAACPPHLSVAFRQSGSPNSKHVRRSSSVINQPVISSRRDIPNSPLTEETPLVMIDRKSYQEKLLKKGRRQGIAYQDLRVKHRFDVSESTLRGRYRNLTKSRSERPREPQWTEHD